MLRYGMPGTLPSLNSFMIAQSYNHKFPNKNKITDFSKLPQYNTAKKLH
jgi:hypothetical protein